MTRGHKTFEYSIDQICEYCLAQTIYELLSYRILSNEVKQAKSDIFSAKICFIVLVISRQGRVNLTRDTCDAIWLIIFNYISFSSMEFNCH